MDKNLDTDYDIIIVGGGANGLGTALDAISRGLKVLLLEEHDYCRVTSSKSTKLLHGGVRYLAQGNIRIVLEDLRERSLVIKNAPNLSYKLPHVVPCYSWFDLGFYYIGLKIYQYISIGRSLGNTKLLSKKSVQDAIPCINTKNLVGGVVYYDGGFNDARLGVYIAQTVNQVKDSCALNYHKVTNFIKEDNKIVGVEFINTLTNEKLSARAQIVVNATGCFSDAVRKLDDKDSVDYITPAKGSHIIMSNDRLQIKQAMLIPKTTDGRVVFCIPWYGKVIIGTTDIKNKEPLLDLKAEDSELDFMLNEVSNYLNIKLTREDILSTYSGQRPLVSADGNKGSKNISRRHKIIRSASGLVSVMGGKWTTHRKVGEDAISFCVKYLKQHVQRSRSKDYPIMGGKNDLEYPFNIYGTHIDILKKLKGFDTKLHNDLPFVEAEVRYAVQYLQAKRVEDVVVRRLNISLLDHKLALECSQRVAEIMAEELSYDEQWIQEEIENFKKVNSFFSI